jgi:hypothetical protein
MLLSILTQRASGSDVRYKPSKVDHAATNDAVHHAAVFNRPKKEGMWLQWLPRG